MIIRCFSVIVLLFFSACSENSIRHTNKHEAEPEDPVELEIAWDYDLNSLPNDSKFGTERDFSEEAIKLAKNHGLKICYIIQSPSYFLTYGLPLAHVLPAPFCGYKDKERSEKMGILLNYKGYKNTHLLSEKQLKKLNSLNVLMVGVVDDGFLDGQKIYNVRHGVDEDLLFNYNIKFSDFERPISFIFSRFNSHKMDWSFLGLDKKKKTLVYMSTVGESEFLDEHSGLQEKVISQLIRLKSKYNIVVRPHPLLSPLLVNELKKDFFVVSVEQSQGFAPLYEIADLIIGNPTSSTTTAATSKPELPIVILRPTKFWPHYKIQHTLDEVAEKNSGKVMSSEEAILQNEHNLDLEQAVENALNDPKHESKIEKRREYFERWFGCVDGYEEYRVIINIFEREGINVKSLKEIYGKFEKVNIRTLCL